MTEPRYDLPALLDIMATLRSENGCSWDRKQSFETLAKYVIEEAHEVTEAIAARDYTHLCEELGDLLLQVVFQAQIGREQGLFDFSDVVQGISAKLVRRHPHVFADQTGLTPEEVSSQWELIKAEEKAGKGQGQWFMEQVSSGLPALARAEKLQKQASKVGFDWNNPRAVLEKMQEELGEIDQALQESPEKVAEEVGDLLFCAVNLARHLNVDSEQALKLTNQKFVRRFNHIEERLQQQGKTLEGSNLGEMESLWQEAKRREGNPPIG
ncbi:MAG: nucleoside triphosphate pyrophosphohydrolase [Fluviicoccus sp.]|uniref:nucleoside triphosphate pyrophosphohydrolase n=1 Tax=Fluviicoccus sp. TaxID=2003552 RepID=UPI00271910E6|nr:nucleoside triphosphate pyrophosphohydrolase [Fluviicoccus sp.]MDO8329040.1 nucleoside triphosphate pyrophosphohydrolase [Fluviicoccus sp.]